MHWDGRRGFADPVRRAEARSLALARSIFDLGLSAIGLRLRAALTGHFQTATAAAKFDRNRSLHERPAPLLVLCKLRDEVKKPATRAGFS